jgi:LuxR family maltose regulon positive regulatory protein
MGILGEWPRGFSSWLISAFRLRIIALDERIVLSAHLIAKLFTPQAVDIVRRVRVTGAIGRALRSGVCWIAAPAGYGKTTAMIDYLARAKAPHVWFRVDEGDQDIAQFFGYLAQSLPSANAALKMPIFGVEYVEQPRDFARLFFRAYFAELKPGTLLVLDDLHTVDTPEFRDILAVMFRELPGTLRCVCLSRQLPSDEFGDRTLSGLQTVLDRSVLEFSDQEAHGLIKLRLKHKADQIDVGTARGWAVGLVLLVERVGISGIDDAPWGASSLFTALGRHFFDALSATEQEMLLILNLLPEVTVALANAVTGSAEAGKLLDRLYHRQLLVTRAKGQVEAFQLHDLLRDFLDHRFDQRLSADEQRAAWIKAAQVLTEANRPDDAIALALRAGAWPLVHDLLLQRADAVIAEGRRATLIEWMGKLPPAELSGWLLYWTGVAHLADDAAAERWLSRAWDAFDASGDQRGKCLTVARAILVKTDSWRTHKGLAVWTLRAATIASQDMPELSPEEDILVLIGLVRAFDYAEENGSDAGQRLAERLLERLGQAERKFPSELRLHASETLIEHAIGTGKAELFEQAVDHVVDDIENPDVTAWHLGLWLVAFGAASGRYFRYSRRGFPYATAEEALRAAIAIGEREALKGVEFGALYHLQLQMKLRNDLSEFGRLVTRLAEIADSRYTTQVAVVADCNAALHTLQGNFANAYRDCDRFMAAIEEADEPIVERLPHYITKFQVLIADRRPREAIDLLTDLLARLQGGGHMRTQLCIMAATALQSKWNCDPDYEEHLSAFLTKLHGANWRGILLNLPDLLTDLLADALDSGIETEFCRALIAERHLIPPARCPISWPWPLKVHLLGGFRIERDGANLELGPKPPMRALDILRVLALAKEHSCSLETLQDWLWPDLDGGQANAACEQALHRLRRLLGRAELITLRGGILQFAADMVWVDVDSWEGSLDDALATGENTLTTVMEQALAAFPGPLHLHGGALAWGTPAADRIRDGFIELSIRTGKRFEAEGDVAQARVTYLRALEHYPESHRLHGAAIEQRLNQSDIAGAAENHQRYLRMLRAAGDLQPSPAIEALLREFSKASPHRD